MTAPGAARDAARAGEVFSFVLIGLGLVEILAGVESGLWFVLLGWFVMSASRAEQMEVRFTRDLATTLVRDVMTPDPVTVPCETTVDVVLHDYVLAHRCSSFPVVDDAGAPAGLVTLGRLRTVTPARRATTPVSQIAWPLAAVTIARPDELVLDVLRRSGDTGDGRIVVCRDGAVVGIVSPSDITRALQFADAVRSATHVAG